ncbi:hypothetical protein CIG19_16830 [Enterobacterales bacterium CwR94]|nr:hypothetical protein CIG19_16830 [Enterobacterales bacterium CwR94]
MLKDFYPRVVITACLPDRPAIQKRFERNRRLTQRFEAQLQQVNAQLAPSLLTAPAWQRYPWCFVMPDQEANRRHFFVGAFIPSSVTPNVALYAWVNESWLLRQLLTRESLPFWLSRALVPLLHGGAQPHQLEEVRKTCRLLQRAGQPGRRGWNRHQPDPLPELDEQLRAVRCSADEEWEEKHGVDAMPWRDWPGCIQNVDTIWLWRQSRYGKVIEAQIINDLGHPIKV